MYKHLAAVAALTILGISAATAAPIIGSIRGIASTTFPCCGYNIANTLDQSGLSVGYTSGVTDFDDYLASNPTHSPQLIHEWFSNAPTATVTYDLGAVLGISAMALWNDEFSGIGAFDLLVSTNNIDYTTVLSDQAPTDNPLSPTPYGADRFDFNGTAARFVRLELRDCPQPLGNQNFQICGIGEVAFRGVPEPASLALLGLGLVGFGYGRRKTR